MTVSAEIFGDISPSRYNNVDQYSVEDFEDELAGLWAAGVKALVWNQYTPYFNDGDPCVFRISCEGVHSIEPITAEDRAEVSAYEADADPWRDSWDTQYVRDPQTGKYDSIKVELDDAAKAVKSFIKEFDHYEDVCRNNFGDHAKVIATPEAFYVEWYEHD